MLLLLLLLLLLMLMSHPQSLIQLLQTGHVVTITHSSYAKIQWFICMQVHYIVDSMYC